MSSRATLPDLDTLNPQAMRSLLLAQQQTLLVQAEELQAQRQQLQAQDQLLAGRQAEIERLQLLIAKLRRMQFGRRSEKWARQIEQLELQLEELQTASALEESTAITPAVIPVAAKPFRRPLPEHLPREVHTHMPDHATCPDCGGKLRELGEDVA